MFSRLQNSHFTKLLPLLLLLLSGCANADAPKPMHILTLGDSITAIFRYQPFLQETLNKEGVQAIFVGSLGEGENKHEGHSGWSIGQIEDNVTKYISDADANVVLL